MKKLLLGLMMMAMVLVVVACGNDDNNQANDPAPTQAQNGGGETANEPAADDELPAEIQALISQFNLPEPRFVPSADVPSWQRDYGHNASLTWYVNMFWWPEHRMGDSWVTTVINEDINVDIHFISGNTDNLNAMIIGGDMPDIITMESWAFDFVNHAYEFAFPLDVLSQVYDPYFLENLLHPQHRAWFTLPNGHIYGIPNEAMNSDEINAGYAFPGSGFLVREDIFLAIGEPDMSTPEGFLDALRAAQAHMPVDSAGRPLTPFSGQSTDISTANNGAFSGVLQDFLAIPVLNPDGTWYDRDANPEYLAWMLVFRQAMEEGLMSIDQFTDDNETINDKFATGNYFAFMTNNTNDVASRLAVIAAGDHPDQMMIPISGPRNSAGDAHTFPAGGINGWTHTFVTQATRDPQTAMQVITYFMSDHGQMVQQFGHEGVTFEFVDGVPTLLPEIQAFLTDDYYGFRDEWGIRTFWMLRRPGFFASQGVMPTGLHGDIQTFNRQFATSRLDFVNLEPTDGQLGRDNDNLDLIRSQAIFNLITADSDAEATQIWEDFLASRGDFDFDNINAYRNDRLRENRERLGMD